MVEIKNTECLDHLTAVIALYWYERTAISSSEPPSIENLFFHGLQCKGHAGIMMSFDILYVE
jgi:predicted nuclease of restriction endonuclease-like (RecB) superfamily